MSYVLQQRLAPKRKAVALPGSLVHLVRFEYFRIFNDQKTFNRACKKKKSFRQYFSTKIDSTRL